MLVELIESWKVVGRSIEFVRRMDRKIFFGKGKIEELNERFKEMKNFFFFFDSVLIDVV